MMRNKNNIRVLVAATTLLFFSNTFSQKIVDPKPITGVNDALLAYNEPSRINSTAIKPSDNSLETRFYTGVSHMLKNNDAEAIVIFRNLIEDFPNVRETYNNLAIIYARQLKFDQARATLELMLREHPNYHKGYETLGDIYTTMAKMNYHRASNSIANNQTARNKATLLDNMYDNSKNNRNE